MPFGRIILLFLARAVPAKRLPQVVVFLAVVSLVLAELRMPIYQKDAFYLPWCRGWELFLGAALALLARAPRSGSILTGAGIAGLAAIAAAIIFYDPSTRFPGWTALLPCGGAALVIFTAGEENPVARVLSFGPLRLIGLCSYSLYLIHWPLFSFAHLYLGAELSLPLRLLLVAISFALSVLSWRFIENPFRAATLPNLRTFGIAAAAICGLFLVATAYSVSDGFPFRVSKKVLLAESAGNGASNYCRYVALAEIPGESACKTGEDSKGSYDFVLWGDSHAEHFVPAIDTLAKSRRLSGIVFSRSGCAPFFAQPPKKRDCRDFNEAVAQWINKHPVKLVMLGGRWSAHRKQIEQIMASGDQASNTSALEQTLAFLNARNVAVSVLDQVPEYPDIVRLCVARALMYGRSADRCSTQPLSRFQSEHKIVDDYFEFLGHRHSFSVASATAALCKGDSCRANDGDTILMRDTNHLTPEGALYVMPSLRIPFLTEPAVRNAAATRAGATASLPLE